MVDDAIKAETPPAASPATDEAAVLSELTELALGLARGFQAQGAAALEAGDLDRAGEAETRFSSLFLGIRRAVALKLKLREQREEAQREAAADKDRLQDEKDRRRRAVGERMSRAIAAERPEARERLTAGLWERLAEDERIDADLADTALPIDVLIARLRRDLGLPPHRPGGAGPAGTKASPAAGETHGTSGPPRDGHGASGPPAGAVAPPRSVPLPPAGGGQGGAGPPAAAAPDADPPERQGREHDRRRPAA